MKSIAQPYIMKTLPISANLWDTRLDNLCVSSVYWLFAVLEHLA